MNGHVCVLGVSILPLSAIFKMNVLYLLILCKARIIKEKEQRLVGWESE
jgi:hypothetical protein